MHKNVVAFNMGLVIYTGGYGNICAKNAYIIYLLPAVGHKIYSIFRHDRFIISLHINLHYKSVSVSDPM